MSTRAMAAVALVVIGVLLLVVRLWLQLVTRD